MKRGSGILLHITSLPSPYGIGDMGPWAYKFADFLSETKQKFWQVLPLTPTTLPSGSPYHGSSAYAGNTLLISPELMVREGLLDKEDTEPMPRFQKNKVDYPRVSSFKEKLFERAYEHFKPSENGEYENFCSENSNWLEDFALFVALKAHFRGKVWGEWPPGIRDRQPEALKTLKNKLQDRIEREKFLQYVFFRQWFSLKSYCNRKGIQIIGDMPFYVSYNSVDVWKNPEFFKLNEKKQPAFVSGVPPDYFSRTGQLWGDPVYRWDALKEQGYSWWIRRIEHNLKLFDFIRIDHFRGFVGYWEVRAGERTAVKGRWVKAPAKNFFTEVCERFPHLPILAEDLGTITPDVREIMRHFGFPGMRVLLFAFGEDLPTNPYAPHNHLKNCIVYTGTHDNNTVRGWFEGEATPEDRERLFRYLGREVHPQEVHWEFIRLAMMSVADMVIIPMQDILGLGEQARMNRPATVKGNWQWRLLPEQLTSTLTRRLLEMTQIYGRA